MSSAWENNNKMVKKMQNNKTPAKTTQVSPVFVCMYSAA